MDIGTNFSSHNQRVFSDSLQERSLYPHSETKDEKKTLRAHNKKGKNLESSIRTTRIPRSHNNRINRRRIYKNQKIELNVATHNINGLKTNSQKIEQLHDWLLDNKVDVLGLAETNISSKEGFFLTKNMENYKSFWANAKAEKKKGSGVGLLISKQ